MIKTQFGTSVTADFSERTWTFEMPDNYSVAAGDFAIIPTQSYQAMVNMLNDILNIENAAFGLKGFDVERLKHSIKVVLDGVQ